MRRTAILIPIIGLIPHLIFSKYKNQILKYLLLFFTILLISFPLYKDVLLERYELRAEKGRFEKDFYKTEARYIENVEMLDEISKFDDPYKVLFGIGNNAFAEAISNGQVVRRMYHSDTAKLYHSVGLFGLFFYFSIYLILLKEILKIRNVKNNNHFKIAALGLLFIQLFVSLNGSITIITFRTVSFLFMGAFIGFAKANTKMLKHEAFPVNIPHNDENISFDENFSKIEIDEYFLWYKSNIINFYHTSHNGTEVIAHANPKFIHNLNSLNNFEFIESWAEDLSWGVLIYNDKNKKRLVIKNDIYGIYPFYFSELNGKIYFSNDFDLLVNIHRGLTINNFAIADIFLFNYPLLNRTIFNEISRVESFSTIFVKGSDYYIERKDILKSIYNKKKYPFDLSISSIKDDVKRNCIPELKKHLALTGGFDSKLLLSTLLYEGFEFETFTWGNKSTADNLSATKTSINLNLKHNNISQDSLEDNPLEYISRLIDYQPNFPVADTLMNYILVNDTLDSSNIFTGIMGGELIVGPIIKAELIATRYASYLTNTKDYIIFMIYYLKTYQIIVWLTRSISNVTLETITNQLKHTLHQKYSKRTKALLNFY
ncbi:hypothetical protein [Tenuifilum thalassicum]|uniref:asparagine synthase (glutamine-hydrolyzing) n=1 Tax=Tenuifilum thalassicum TaxID=2590900 RepID=A0A7D4BQI8_9BACT|nr:hypothetical protein [Tenuifilum thalassicum]QKG78801.1 hypothetical protein FHG85_00460 [Tenuifilum thalassicum]